MNFKFHTLALRACLIWPRWAFPFSPLPFRWGPNFKWISFRTENIPSLVITYESFKIEFKHQLLCSIFSLTTCPTPGQVPYSIPSTLTKRCMHYLHSILTVKHWSHTVNMHSSVSFNLPAPPSPQVCGGQEPCPFHAQGQQVTGTQWLFPD